jgi:hypothetical protein
MRNLVKVEGTHSIMYVSTIRHSRLRSMNIHEFWIWRIRDFRVPPSCVTIGVNVSEESEVSQLRVTTHNVTSHKPSLPRHCHLTWEGKWKCVDMSLPCSDFHIVLNSVCRGKKENIKHKVPPENWVRGIWTLPSFCWQIRTTFEKSQNRGRQQVFINKWLPSWSAPVPPS